MVFSVYDDNIFLFFFFGVFNVFSIENFKFYFKFNKMWPWTLQRKSCMTKDVSKAGKVDPGDRGNRTCEICL